MKQALIIIDVQNDYFSEGKMELYQPQLALEKILKVREYFRNQQLPVYYIQHINSNPGATFFQPDSHGIELHHQLLPIADTNEFIIHKSYPNSFLQTTLHEHLQQQNIEQLVICGMMTHMCVDSTTRQAVEFGYQPIVIADACATMNLEFNSNIISATNVQNSFLAALNYLATVRSAEQFLS